MGIPYLCMGTFFFLLIQARKPKASSSTYIKGHIDPMSDACFMNGLVGAFTGKRHEINRDSFDIIKRHTSPLKECKANGSKNWTPFNQQPDISNYRMKVQNNYSEAVEQMSEFVNEYLAENKYNWLVDALVGTIERDGLILDDDEFYIMPDGSKKTKAQMRNMELFELQPFLVGVLHYIVDKRSKTNIEGKATLETWGDKPNTTKERVLKSDVRLSANRGIKAHYYNVEDEAMGIAEENIKPESDKVDEEEPKEKVEDTGDQTEQQYNNMENSANTRPTSYSSVIMTGEHAKSYTIYGNATFIEGEVDD